MPIYEYVCCVCGHSFELIVDQSAAGNKPFCPVCPYKHRACDRVMSAPSFVIHGASEANGYRGPSNA